LHEPLEKQQQAAMGALARADEAASGTIDSSAAISAMTALQGAKRETDGTAKRKAHAEVQISLEDVQNIMREMEVSRNVAEHTLREHKGSLETALRALIDT